MKNVDPTFSWDAKLIEPPRFSIIFLLMLRPNPLP